MGQTDGHQNGHQRTNTGMKKHSPIAASARSDLVRLAGVEPATLGLEVRCSIQLSYRRVRQLRYTSDARTDGGLVTGKFTPDEKVFYINDSRRRHIRAFELLPNGTLAKQTDRVFADLAGSEPGVPDGMKVDVEGNVYCGGAGGIWIMDPHGKKLGRIVHGAPATTNIAFGGDNWKTLYFTSRNHLWPVGVKIPGIPVPVAKK
jgi:hypothetical protein